MVRSRLAVALGLVALLSVTAASGAPANLGSAAGVAPHRACRTYPPVRGDAVDRWLLSETLRDLK